MDAKWYKKALENTIEPNRLPEIINKVHILVQGSQHTSEVFSSHILNYEIKLGKGGSTVSAPPLLRDYGKVQFTKGLNIKGGLTFIKL
ncbi:MAG: hypothetical protein ACI9K1_001890 [Arcticibacterium sp.]|jgi:hypothetical protein